MARKKSTSPENENQVQMEETPADIVKSVKPYLGTVIISPESSAEDGQIVEIRMEPDNSADPMALAVYAGDEKIGYMGNKKTTVRPGTKTAAKLHSYFEDERVAKVCAYLSEGQMTDSGKARLLSFKAELFFVPKGKAAEKGKAETIRYSVIGGEMMCPKREALQNILIKAAADKDKDNMSKPVQVYVTDSPHPDCVFFNWDGAKAGWVKNSGEDETIRDETVKAQKNKEFKRLVALLKNGEITAMASSTEKDKYFLDVTFEPKDSKSTQDLIGSTVERCVEQAKVLEAKVRFMKEQNIPDGIITRVMEQIKRFPPELEAMIPVPENLFLEDVDQQVLLRALVYRLHGKHLRLVGEKGCGKNTLINTVCWLLHKPLFMVQGNSDLDKTDLLGTRTIQNGSMGYELSTFLQVLEAGGDIDLDEANAIKPDVEILIHSLADNTRAINVPGYGEVRMGKDACMWATMNEDYVGTSDMNDATIDRFVTIRLKAPDSMATVLAQCVPTATAKEISACQKVHADVLKAVRDGTISGTCISIRGLIDALQCAKDLGLKNALMDTLAAKPQDADERRTLKTIISNNFR